MRSLFGILAIASLAWACSTPAAVDEGAATNEDELASALRIDAPKANLAVGETTHVLIASPAYWNRTGVQLRAGESYRFETYPDAQWTDWFIRTGPNGFSTEEAPAFSHAALAPLESQRRMPTARWFALTGAIGTTEESAFVIGVGVTQRISKSGEFTAFANDVPGFYDNNKGSLLLKITRLE